MHERSSSPAPDPERAPQAQVAPAGQVEYFHAPHHHRPSAGPGLVLGALGLGLIFLGGCFMIGVLALYGSTGTDWSNPGIYLYLVVLYVSAGLCFIGAGVLLRLAVKSLLKAARG